MLFTETVFHQGLTHDHIRVGVGFFFSYCNRQINSSSRSCSGGEGLRLMVPAPANFLFFKLQNKQKQSARTQEYA